MSRTAEGKNFDYVKEFAETMTMDDIMNFSLPDLVKVDRQLRSGEAVKRPDRIDSSWVGSVSARNICTKIVHCETEGFVQPRPRRTEHRLSDQFAPLHVEDTDMIDMSLMHAFLSAAVAAPSSLYYEPSESEWRAEPADELRRGSDVNGELSDFVMNLLKECDVGHEFEAGRTHFNALLRSCVD